MPLTLSQQLAALERMTIAELRGRYAEVFGEPTRAHNRPWLIKRIAWRLQAIAEGFVWRHAVPVPDTAIRSRIARGDQQQRSQNQYTHQRHDVLPLTKMLRRRTTLVRDIPSRLSPRVGAWCRSNRK